jgi:hypothetical protein
MNQIRQQGPPQPLQYGMSLATDGAQLPVEYSQNRSQNRPQIEPSNLQPNSHQMALSNGMRTLRYTTPASHEQYERLHMEQRNLTRQPVARSNGHPHASEYIDPRLQQQQQRLTQQQMSQQYAARPSMAPQQMAPQQMVSQQMVQQEMAQQQMAPQKMGQHMAQRSPAQRAPAHRHTYIPTQQQSVAPSSHHGLPRQSTSQHSHHGLPQEQVPPLHRDNAKGYISTTVGRESNNTSPRSTTPGMHLRLYSNEQSRTGSFNTQGQRVPGTSHHPYDQATGSAVYMSMSQNGQYLVSNGRTNHPQHTPSNSGYASAQLGPMNSASPNCTSPLAPISHDLSQQLHAPQGHPSGHVHHNGAMHAPHRHPSGQGHRSGALGSSIGRSMEVTKQPPGDPYQRSQQPVQYNVNRFQQSQNPAFQNGIPVSEVQFSNHPPPSLGFAQVEQDLAQVSHMHEPIQSRQDAAPPNLTAAGVMSSNANLSMENASATQPLLTFDTANIGDSMDGFSWDDWLMDDYPQQDSHDGVETMSNEMEKEQQDLGLRTPTTPVQTGNAETLINPKKRGATSIDEEPSAKRPKSESASQIPTPMSRDSSTESSVDPSLLSITVDSTQSPALEMQATNTAPQAARDPKEGSSGTNKAMGATLQRAHDPQEESSGTNNEPVVGHIGFDNAAGNLPPNTTATLEVGVGHTVFFEHDEASAFYRQHQVKALRAYNLIMERIENSKKSAFRRLLLSFTTLDDYRKKKANPGTPLKGAEIDAFYPVPTRGLDLEPYPDWVLEWRLINPEELFED